MGLEGLLNSDAMPTLRAVARFASARHRLILGNIANISTPGYQTQDVNVRAFQQELAKAVERRRAGSGDDSGGGTAELDLKSTDQFRVSPSGDISLTPQKVGGNVLFHDRNNRDLERLMQDLTENATMFRLATDLLRSRAAMLDAAIRERP